MTMGNQLDGLLSHWQPAVFANKLIDCPVHGKLHLQHAAVLMTQAYDQMIYHHTQYKCHQQYTMPSSGTKRQAP